MKQLYVFVYLICCACFATAQQVITIDPGQDILVRRNAAGDLSLQAPARALACSIQEAVPQLTGIDEVKALTIGQSVYLFARGYDRLKPGWRASATILLSETIPGSYMADQLTIICSSLDYCQECALTPACACARGEGTCQQQAAFFCGLKKVTVTISNE